MLWETLWGKNFKLKVLGREFEGEPFLKRVSLNKYLQSSIRPMSCVPFFLCKCLFKPDACGVESFVETAVALGVLDDSLDRILVRVS